MFKVSKKADDDAVVLDKVKILENYTDFSQVPQANKLMLAKISVVIDEYIEEYHLDAITLRCWNEMEPIKSMPMCTAQ